MKNLILSIFVLASLAFSQESNHKLDSLANVVSQNIKRDIIIGEKLQKATTYEMLSVLIPFIGGTLIGTRLLTSDDYSKEDIQSMILIGSGTSLVGVGFYTAHIFTMYDIAFEFRGKVSISD